MGAGVEGGIDEEKDAENKDDGDEGENAPREDDAVTFGDGGEGHGRAARRADIWSSVPMVMRRWLPVRGPGK